MMKVGRRPLIIVSFALTGISLFLYPFLSYNLGVAYVLVMVGKFGISSSFNLIIIWTVELFPTQVKGTAFAICNVFGRVGGIVAPLISAALPKWFMLLFGSLSLMCCVVSIFLKETKGAEIQDNVHEDSPT